MLLQGLDEVSVVIFIWRWPYMVVCRVMRRDYMEVWHTDWKFKIAELTATVGRNFISVYVHLDL